jgi:alkanesulfonate monooxygenase SsuD/methylene tetrahydromethanopterin reductase-like flavin-dependent oxidoreductase (luciferase family)
MAIARPFLASGHAMSKNNWIIVASLGRSSGRFYRYSDIRCEPFPVQKPHPPIWVGGHSRAVLRRTARHDDGWYPVGLP